MLIFGVAQFGETQFVGDSVLVPFIPLWPLAPLDVKDSRTPAHGRGDNVSKSIQLAEHVAIDLVIHQLAIV